jgi:hypothetical protein
MNSGSGNLGSEYVSIIGTTNFGTCSRIDFQSWPRCICSYYRHKFKVALILLISLSNLSQHLCTEPHVWFLEIKTEAPPINRSPMYKYLVRILEYFRATPNRRNPLRSLETAVGDLDKLCQLSKQYNHWTQMNFEFVRSMLSQLGTAVRNKQRI